MLYETITIIIRNTKKLLSTVCIMIGLEDSICVKSFLIMSFSDPYSVRMRENTEQKNSKYGHFSRTVSLTNKLRDGQKRVYNLVEHQRWNFFAKIVNGF